MAPDQIVLDPGIDLAKTPAQSIELLRRLPELAPLGRPLLLAVSRKDFVGALTERRPRRATPARWPRWARRCAAARASCACTTWRARATTCACTTALTERRRRRARARGPN